MESYGSYCHSLQSTTRVSTVPLEFGTSVQCKGKCIARSCVVKSISDMRRLDIRHFLEFLELRCVSHKQKPVNRDRYEGLLER